MLGYSTKVSLREGLLSMIDWISVPWSEAFFLPSAARDRLAARSGDLEVTAHLTRHARTAVSRHTQVTERSPACSHARIVRHADAGAPLHGFETAFGEIAPRLVDAAGHDVTIYCRGSHYPDELRVASHRGFA
jgi:hypothetical protein